MGAQAVPSGPLTLRDSLCQSVQGSDGMAHARPVPAGTGAIDTLKDLYPALAACWEVPAGLGRFERTEITARFSLRSDGSVIGTPRVTFASQSPDSRARAVLTQATLEAIRRCTPVRVTPALGGAIAGRPIALRFTHQGPIGQGI
ncbi:hypothetical protein G3T14_04825 [Methylobacterium sp. BTF04]|nr:hypothetical protein [Methylobacterium sp. BTF04]